MSRYYTNRVTLAGNLVDSPKSTALPSGENVVEATIVVNEKFVSRGESKEKSTFQDIFAFGKTGEILAEVPKGGNIVVEGSIETERWKTAEGENRSKNRVKIFRVNKLFDDSRNTESDDGSPWGT